jgi:uncharacterized protein (DUF1499 family)
MKLFRPSLLPSRPRGPVVTVGIASLLLLLAASACQAATADSTFDQTAGRFAPCPESPNCISSQAEPTDETHYMPPLAYTGTVAETKQQLLAIINELPRTTLVEERDNYLHVEFRSLVFRFVDDVEFFIDESAGLVHFRSAARLGQSDLGVNRKRMTEIAEMFGR